MKTTRHLTALAVAVLVIFGTGCVTGPTVQPKLNKPPVEFSAR